MPKSRGAYPRPSLARVALLALYMTAGSPAVFPIAVTVSGGFGFVIDSADVTLGAGGPLSSQHSSPDNAVVIDVTDTAGDADAWQIQVRKEDSLWHGSLDLRVLRTGGGTGSGSTSGGDVLPVELLATDQVFFEGSGPVQDIPVRLILDGVSVLVPADSYSSIIYFTIVDI